MVVVPLSAPLIAIESVLAVAPVVVRLVLASVPNWPPGR